METPDLNRCISFLPARSFFLVSPSSPENTTSNTLTGLYVQILSSFTVYEARHNEYCA